MSIFKLLAVLGIMNVLPSSSRETYKIFLSTASSAITTSAFFDLPTKYFLNPRNPYFNVYFQIKITILVEASISVMSHLNPHQLA